MNNQAAVDFLHRWSQHPWILTAIRPDKKGIETRTFSDTKSVLRWLIEHNGQDNIYFSVNPAVSEMNRKPSKEDVKELAWLHVDLDPRAGEDLEAEKVRILERLTKNPPKGVLPPTVIIFSGGGYQAFWKLKEPVHIGGNIIKADDAARYNQALEIAFGADHCHNVDRIMRLPGTLNIPDAVKLKKGRKPVVAELHRFDEELVYDISAFGQAPAVQMAHEGIGTAVVTLDIEAKPIESVDELGEWGADERLKIIIAQGRFPGETKTPDDSRSAWLFDALCRMARLNVPKERQLGIITDPRFQISTSVLEKRSNAMRYALRQIERAEEEVIEPELRRLNEQFAVIGNMGGKCRVIEEIWDDNLKRARLTKQSFADFRNRHMHRSITGKGKNGNVTNIPLGHWWLLHPRRRQYNKVTFSPGREVEGDYNLWRGFDVEPIQGDFSLFHDHLYRNVCKHSEPILEYLLSWMARTVQFPNEPGQVCVVMQGPQGIGKSVTAKVFGSLFGRHFLHISNPSHLVGTFNAHFRDVVVLFADEGFFAGDPKHVSTLKTLITEDTLQIEAKGIDAETAPNYIHLMMASNSDHVIRAARDERRFLVLDVAADNRRDSVFFQQMMDQMYKQGGREALLHFLLSRDISKFDVRDVPSTRALQEQKIFSMGPEETWWFESLSNGSIAGATWPEEIRKDDITQSFVDYCERFRFNRRGSSLTLGRFLGRVCPGIAACQKYYEVENGNGKPKRIRGYIYKLPDLETVRKKWEELYGEQEWPAEPVEQQTSAF